MNDMSDPKRHTFRRFKDGETVWDQSDLHTKIFQGERTYKCPTYVRRTPPCQANCPSGHDIRGWLSIARGIDKPPVAGMPWQEYAFQRMAGANPFPAMMGRVCPAPCQQNCNRNDVEDFVGINSIEQYVGDWAIEHKLKLPAAGKATCKSVAVVGGGPAGLAMAYFLRRKGHAVTVYEAREKLGGMTRYGIPGYRTPREVLEAETQRILDLGVTVITGKKVGVDIPLAELEKKFDAVFMALGAQNGAPLGVPGGNASNCISGLSFLNAFNDGRLRDVASRVLVIGGGDTAMDVAAVARRLPVEGAEVSRTERDVATIAKRQGAEVTIVYRRPISKMPAAREEIEHVLREGVQIRPSLAPVSVVLDAKGRAKALRVVEVDWVDGKMQKRPNSEFDIECDLIVAALGQSGDFTGMPELDNGRGLITVDGLYRWAGRPGIFAGGDVLRPHLLTTAVGHARIAAQVIDQYVRGEAMEKRPKIDVYQFDLPMELEQRGLKPSAYDHSHGTGTDQANYAIHNYEDRSANLSVSASELFKGHFAYAPRHARTERSVTPETVLGDFAERIRGLTEEEAVAEAKRCMSCGSCMECDNCVIYCPKGAVERLPKEKRAVGQYVQTDYAKCVGCHICFDVCPAGYIQMGLERITV
jgi:NADPH-dependent glutamate synthase beta subunit-like oxidoreductase